MGRDRKQDEGRKQEGWPEKTATERVPAVRIKDQAVVIRFVPETQQFEFQFGPNEQFYFDRNVLGAALIDAAKRVEGEPA